MRAWKREGDVATHLEMTATEGRDLNLMWDRTRMAGDVELLHEGEPNPPPNPAPLPCAPNPNCISIQVMSVPCLATLSSSSH
jgi:hypothetical protein